MELKTIILLPLMVVSLGTVSTTGMTFNVCSKEVCGGQDPPSNPADFSDLVDTEMRREDGYRCICLRGQQAKEPCKTSGDCIQGYHCENKMCMCPCDNQAKPFCDHLYSTCKMSGTTPKCECKVNYKCSQRADIPVCVFWGDGNVTEYWNHCLAVSETCQLSVDDMRWEIHYDTCDSLHDYVDYFSYEDSFYTHGNKIRHFVVKQGMFAPDLIGWKPNSRDSMLYGHGFYPRPEPEPESGPMS